MIKVVVSGACGKMGREVLKAVMNASTLELVGAVDTHSEAVDVGTLIGMAPT
ncbi:MAG: 4-hydroxy-tetrahydrodipicolinate reductase, partial [Selenomonadales bacterium]|nr:4-hydroxy-tetrahydrodipicolinate reductase [Selenomonadales bacterium]